MAELHLKRQRGLALITAVFVVAIVSTVAAFMALGQQIWIRQAQNFSDRAQGDAVARGAINYALMVLREDARNPSTSGKDDYTEIWAKPIATPVENGIGAGQIVDAQARFNLNNLVDASNASGQTAQQPFVQMLRRLLQNLSLNQNLADAIVDWLDNDDTGPAGAEDVYYLTLSPPYRAANKKMYSVEELRLIKGIDAKTFAVLAPYVVALPDITKINVNTADPVVLAALYPSAPANLKQEVERRKTDPFDNFSEFESRVGSAPNLADVADVVSSNFLLEVQTKFGRVNRGTRTLIKRAGNVQVVWQEQMLPVPPKTAPAP